MPKDFADLQDRFPGILQQTLLDVGIDSVDILRCLRQSPLVSSGGDGSFVLKIKRQFLELLDYELLSKLYVNPAIASFRMSSVLKFQFDDLPLERIKPYIPLGPVQVNFIKAIADRPLFDFDRHALLVGDALNLLAAFESGSILEELISIVIAETMTYPDKSPIKCSRLADGAVYLPLDEDASFISFYILSVVVMLPCCIDWAMLLDIQELQQLHQ